MPLKAETARRGVVLSYDPRLRSTRLPPRAVHSWRQIDRQILVTPLTFDAVMGDTGL